MKAGRVDGHLVRAEWNATTRVIVHVGDECAIDTDASEISPWDGVDFRRKCQTHRLRPIKTSRPAHTHDLAANAAEIPAAAAYGG